jgi:HEAT repeat protein
MRAIVPKLVVLVLGAAIGAGGYHLYASFKAGADVAQPEAPRDLTDAEIREGLLSADLKARLDAVAQIDKLPEAECRAALLGALQADYAATRLTATSALAKRFPTHPEVVEALLSAAGNDPDPDVRQAAFTALQKSGDSRALDLALAALESTDASLAAKLTAAETLDRLTGETSAATLEDLLGRAEEAGDELFMQWEEWLAEHREKLVWDAEKSRFVKQR